MSGANPVAAAVGNLGRAVGQTGKLFQSLQDEQERQDLTDAEIIMRRESAKLAGDLALNKSPMEHEAMAVKKFDAVRTMILGNKNLSPKSYDMLAERIDLFTSGKLEKIGTDAKLMQVENGKMLTRAANSMDMAEGDFVTPLKRLEENSGSYSPEEYEVRKMEIESAGRHHIHQEQALNGNVEFFEGEVSGLSESDRIRLMRSAKTNKARKESEAMDIINKSVEAKMIQTREDLARNMENDPRISEATRNLALKNWDNTRPISYSEKKKILDRADSLFKDFSEGRLAREDYAKKHHEITTEVNAMGRREGASKIRSRVDQLDPSRWTEGKKIKTLNQEDRVEDISKIIWESGGFSNPGTLPKESNTEDRLRHGKALEEAEKKREAAEIELQKWLSDPKNKDAGWDDISQRMREISSGGAARELIEEGDQDLGLEFLELMGDEDTLLPRIK